MRILFAWELGANFGHLTQDLPLARRLRDLGHRVEFACANQGVAHHLLTPEGFRFVPTPAVMVRPEDPRAPNLSHAGVLAGSGFTDGPMLCGVVQGWLNLFALLQPDVIVSDHAPAVLLAARVAGLPCLPIGTGFTVPPAVTPFPWVPLDLPPDPKKLMAVEAPVLATVNAVLDRFGSPRLDALADLYRGPAIITSFPELDHYGARADAFYAGHFAADLDQGEVRWPGGRTRKIFAYLRKDVAGLEPLLAAFAQVDADVLCVLPDAAPMHRSLQSDHFRIEDRGVALATVLADADLVVGYAGAGTVASALLAGVPLLLLSTGKAERSMTAARVEAMGAGKWLRRPADRKGYLAALAALLAPDSPCRTAARAFRDRHRDFDPAAAIDRAAARILEAGRSPACVPGPVTQPVGSGREGGGYDRDRLRSPGAEPVRPGHAGPWA